MSYFCTPDMRVLHFVVGPVSAEKLFAEAAWAHRVYDEVRYRGIDELTKDQAEKLSRLQTQAVEREHLASLDNEAEAFARRLAEHRAACGKPSQASYVQTASYARPAGKKPPRERWESLVWNVGGNAEARAHRLLAIDPLPPLAEVDSTVFRALAGERVNDRDGSIERAMAKIRKAEKDGRPVLFAFYKYGYGSRTPSLWKTYGDAAPSKLLRQFTVVELPLKELPALSAQLPGFALPVVADEASVQLVFVNCRMQQISAMSDMRQTDLLPGVLRYAIAQNQIALAERLIAEDRPADAKRVLYKARRSKDRDTAMHAEAVLATIIAK